MNLEVLPVIVATLFDRNNRTVFQTRLSGEDLLKRLGVEENSQTSPQLNQGISHIVIKYPSVSSVCLPIDPKDAA